MQEITSVPKAPSFVNGVINLRGKVIPVLDLRRRFSMRETEHTKDSRIVVVDIHGQDIGMVVDAVTEVLRIPNSAVEPPSSIVTTMDSDYLEGIAKLEGQLVILLDLTKVFGDDVELLQGFNKNYPRATTHCNQRGFRNGTDRNRISLTSAAGRRCYLAGSGFEPQDSF